MSGKSRQWLYDRVNGVSREVDETPPCFLCFPPPFLKCCPVLLEENGCCSCVGQIGACSPDDSTSRKAVLKYALIMNVCGLFLTLFAALAMAENESILKMASFGTAELTSLPVDTMEPVTIDLGLRAALFNNPNTYGEQLIPFDQFCDLMDRGLEMYMDPKECGECNRVSDQLFTAILIALVAYIPTISTDVLRMYGNYDVNCQKFWAGFMSLFTLAGCVLCYFQFTNACLASFNDGDTSFSKTGILVESGSPFETVVVNFDWSIGNGMICLFAGFALKFLDFICNCLIPTPSITRDEKLKREYEQLALAGSDDEADADYD